MRTQKYLWGVFILLLFYSCKKLDPKIEQASFLELNTYQVNYSGTYANGGPGTTYHKFTDVLVAANGKTYGIFPLPSKIPIDAEGNVALSIAPVIKVNGVSGVRSEYSMMKTFSANALLKRGELTSLPMQFDYYSGINFIWTEDFEGSGYSIVPHTVNDTSLVRVNTEKFEGNNSLKIEMNNGESSTMVRTSTALAIPNSGQEVYVELHYKCNQRFDIGVISGTNPSDIRLIGGANASESWNKIYFYITPAASTTPTSPTYYIYFSVTKTTDVPLIYLDNIKLLAK